MVDRKWSRQDYLDTAISRGVPPEQAEQIADGLMAAHERAAAGAPGWERLCLETPMEVITKYRGLFRTSMVSNPTEDPAGQIESGISSVFGYGLLCGMLLAEHGIGPSTIEREKAQENLREIHDWIEALHLERETGEETSP